MLTSSRKICEFVIAENLKIWKCARKNKRVYARASHVKEKSWLINVALPVPAHFAGMDHQLQDMQVAVIRAVLPENDKRRREEMRFIHNSGTLTPGGLNQDFSFTWLARAHTRLFLRAHFQIFRYNELTYFPWYSLYSQVRERAKPIT